MNDDTPPGHCRGGIGSNGRSHDQVTTLDGTMLPAMARRERVRSMTDRQLHQALLDAFGDWSTDNGTTRDHVARYARLERLLGEESRRMTQGRRVCVCEACCASWPDLENTERA